MSVFSRKSLSLSSCVSAVFIVAIVALPAGLSAAIHVAVTGSDLTGDGSLGNPFGTLQHAVYEADPGDTILLRGGTHESGEIRIGVSDLTIRSFPGEWATVEASLDFPDTTSCLWYRPEDYPIDGGLIENLEIVGGYLYALKFDGTWCWDTCYSRNIVVQDCIIHDTGRDCIKITPGCDDITIRRCEIYNSGVGPANLLDDPNAEGIDNVNADRCFVQNCYIHDISTTGIYVKGGATDCVIEGNLIMNCGAAGVMLGFYTDEEWFDTVANPDYYENIDGTVKNNIIVEADWAGIGMYSALRPSVYNNTVIACADTYHAALFFSKGSIWVSESLTLEPPNVGVTVLNNIFVQKTTTLNPIVRIRPGALEGASIIDYNRYYTPGGAEFMDDSVTWETLSYTAWRDSTGFDMNSWEGDPQLDIGYHLQSASPCIDAGFTVAAVLDDYDGNARVAPLDVGADEFGAGAPLTVPPPAGVIGTGAGIPTYVSDAAPTLPTTSAITAFPNPFNSAVTISLDGVGAGLAPALVEIFDLSGRRVETLRPSATSLEKGGQEIPLFKGDLGGSLTPLTKGGQGGSFTWQPSASLPSGVYLVRARFDGRGDLAPTGNAAVKRVVYLK